LVVDGRRLADYVSSIGLLEEKRPQRRKRSHIGAVLCETVLQAGLNYRTVVQPRVSRVLELFPEAARLSQFSRILLHYGAYHVLMWKHYEKPRRLTEIVWLLQDRSIETVGDLATWLENSRNRECLLQLRGFGPKTVDYMAMISGLDEVAVDRHIRAFLRVAGIARRDYKDMRRTVCVAADLLGVSRASLDQAIWERLALRE
jgi:endonuclease III